MDTPVLKKTLPLKRVYRSLWALALGDALGSVSEFQSLSEVLETWVRHQHEGWPFVPVAQGDQARSGDATDDAMMARAVVRAWIDGGGQLHGAEVGQRFLAWMAGNPSDIGVTTYRALCALRAGTPWWQGGRGQWLEDPHSWSNGSLMRNGVIAAMAPDSTTALRWSLLHGLITHWAPLPALCCAAQTWLLRTAPSWKEDGPGYDWPEDFRAAWDRWLAEEVLRADHDPDAAIVARWLEESASQHAEAWNLFLEADFDPDRFRPFREFGPAGYCLRSLQIGVWAMLWALRGRPYPEDLLPDGFPRSPFQRSGCWVLGWVAMVGRDADTYGAIAGPMITLMDPFPPGFRPRLEAMEGLPSQPERCE